MLCGTMWFPMPPRQMKRCWSREDGGVGGVKRFVLIIVYFLLVFCLIVFVCFGRIFYVFVFCFFFYLCLEGCWGTGVVVNMEGVGDEWTWGT